MLSQQEKRSYLLYQSNRSVIDLKAELSIVKKPDPDFLTRD